MFIWADLNADPLVIFLWKLTGSRKRGRERGIDKEGRGEGRGGSRSSLQFGNEGLCAANFLIKGAKDHQHSLLGFTLNKPDPAARCHC